MIEARFAHFREIEATLNATKFHDLRGHTMERLNYEITNLLPNTSDTSLEYLDPDLVQKVRVGLTSCGFKVMPCSAPNCDGHGTYRASCNRRACPACGYREAAQRAERLASSIRHPTRCAHVVLTLGRVPFTDLFPALLRLLDAFRKLRRRACFRNVKGGLRAIQIVPKLDGFHLHLHLFLDGFVENRNIHNRPLESDWTDLTKLSSDQDRCSVELVQCKSRTHAETTIRYIYAGLAIDFAEAQIENTYPADYPALSEIVTAIHNRQLNGSWGTLRKLLAQKPKPPKRRRPRLSGPPLPNCSTCGSPTIRPAPHPGPGKRKRPP